MNSSLSIIREPSVALALQIFLVLIKYIYNSKAYWYFLTIGNANFCVWWAVCWRHFRKIQGQSCLANDCIFQEWITSTLFLCLRINLLPTPSSTVTVSSPDQTTLGLCYHSAAVFWPCFFSSFAFYLAEGISVSWKRHCTRWIPVFGLKDNVLFWCTPDTSCF